MGGVIPSDHEHLARAERRYLQDSEFRTKVEQVVSVMMSSVARIESGSHFVDQYLKQERILIRMTVAVTLLMEEEAKNA